MKVLLKTLGIFLASCSLLIMGSVSPASAAFIAGLSATTTSTLVNGQTIPNDIVVNFTAPTAMSLSSLNRINVNFNGATGIGADKPCGSSVTFSSVPPTTGVDCRMVTIGSTSIVYLIAQTQIAYSANTVWTFTIAGGTLTMPSSGPLTIEPRTTITGSSPAFVDTATTTNLITVIPNSTVSFDANGGAGNMPDQVNNSAASLIQNAFTRENHTFVGWNTSRNGTGTSFQDLGTYQFTSSTVLYAQWRANLAHSGSFTMPLALLSFTLTLTGLILYRFTRSSFIH